MQKWTLQLWKQQTDEKGWNRQGLPWHLERTRHRGENAIATRNNLDASIICRLSLGDDWKAETSDLNILRCPPKSNKRVRAYAGWVGKKWFLFLYFLNCHLHAGCARGQCGEARGLPLMPMRCLHLVSFVCWGESGRYRNTCEPRLAAMKPKSAHQNWLLGSGLRKRHWSTRHLKPCHSFQILHLFFTLNQHQMPFSKSPPHLPPLQTHPGIQHYVP